MIRRLPPRLRILTVIAGLAFVLQPVAAVAGDGASWRQLGGGPGHAGVPSGSSIIDSSNVDDLRLAWSRPMERSSSPSLVGGRVYLVRERLDTYADRLLVLSARTGRTVWRSTRLPAGDAAQPVVVGGFVYVGMRIFSNTARLFVFPVSGCASPCPPQWTARWSVGYHDDGYPDGSEQVTVANGVVYAASLASDPRGLLAFDASGCGAPVCDPIWSAPYPPAQLVWGPPAVGGGAVFVSTWTLHAYDAEGCGSPTCGELWKSTSSSVGTNAVVAGDTVYAQTSQSFSALPSAGCADPVCEPSWSGSTYPMNGTDGFAVGSGWVVVGNSKVFAFPTGGCGAPAATRCEAAWTSASMGASGVSIVNDVAFVSVSGGTGVFALAGCGAPMCEPIVTLPDLDAFEGQTVIGRDIVLASALQAVTAYRLPS